MGQGAKFLFETDFGNPEVAKRNARNFTEADVQAARAEALQEARAELGAREEKRAADLAAQIAATVEQLVAQRAADLQAASECAVDIAVTICRKVLPTLAAQGALDEIAGHISRALADVQGEPRVVVRMSEANVAALRHRVDALANGFDGTLVLLPDDHLSDSDCHVMWADGGSERDVARLWAQIDQAVEQITAAGIGAGEPTPEDRSAPAAAVPDAAAPSDTPTEQQSPANG